MTEQTKPTEAEQTEETTPPEQAEREQALTRIKAQMDEQVGYWREGLEDSPMKKAFALGAMMGIKLSADRVQPGQDVVKLPYWWQAQCDRYDV